jgi:1-acyl-sn-glycerol-3-phosphate acyltransferase
MPAVPASARAPLPVRALRLLRLAAHLFAGLFTVTVRFPRWNERRRRIAIRRWSRRLLRLVDLRVRLEGRPVTWPAHCLLVLNHVSWLDIFLVDAVRPARFVAKSEIAGWPLVGTLVTRAGTLYIDRGSRKAARLTNALIAEAMRDGALVACFPEGTTSHGTSVGRFHGALFQPAIDAGAMVLPVVLRYTDRQGRPTQDCSYVGDESLLASVWRIVSARAHLAELRFLAPLATTGRERRELAQEAHAALAATLARANGQ